jgi:two-component system OmpR family sensor kinase
MVVTVAVIALGWGLDEMYGYYTDQPVDNDLILSEETITGLARTFSALENPEKFIETWNQNSNTVLTLQPYGEFQIPELLQPQFFQGQALSLQSENEISVHYYLPDSRQVFSFSFPAGLHSLDDSTLRLGLTLVFYAGVILVILVWLYPLIKRLLVLRNTAKAFGEGKLESRVKIGGLSFISDIENEFNHMAQRIQTLIGDNKLLSSAVSHDLRTPLSRLRFGIETLAETYGDVEREQFINRILLDLNEMESLVESLLSFARMDASRVKIKFARTDLVGIVSSGQEEMAANKPAVRLDIPAETAFIEADAGFIKMLYANLLKNAMQHAQAEVRISLPGDAKHWYLIVEDDGPGIPAAQRKDVLKPFVRGSSANTKRSGHGLGLAIVDRIAQWHRAELEILESTDLGGLKVVVAFRKYPD